MKILIIENTANNIIDIRNYDHFIIENINNFKQIQSEMLNRQKSLYLYKYCVLEDDWFIPFYMNIKNKLTNSMQEFSFERVTVNDLNLSEEQIKEIAHKEIDTNLSQAYNSLLPYLADILEQLNLENVDKTVLEQIRGLENEKLNFDKNKYLHKII